MLVGNAAGSEREQGQAGVPDGRLAGLGTQTFAVLDHETLPAVDRLAQRRVVKAVTERRERDDPPHPRRLDPAPRAVRLLTLADPALGGGDGAAAERVRPTRWTRPPRNRADG